MIRRIYLVIITFLLSHSIACANSFYVSPIVAYDSFKFQNSNWIGFTPRLALGYGMIYNEWVSFLFEIFGNPKPLTKQSHDDDNDATDTNDNDIDEIKIHPSWSYGAAILPMLNLDYVLSMFAHLGVINTKFSTVNQQRVGGQIGGGLAVLLSDCWTLRAEYIYTRYKSIDDLGKPSSGEFALGLIYQFM